MWLAEVIRSYQNDMEVQNIIVELLTMPYNVSYYSYCDGLLRFKGKLFVGSDGTLRSQILRYMHDSSIGDHSRIIATYQRLTSVFWWPGVRQQVQDYVNACHTCQIRT